MKRIRVPRVPVAVLVYLLVALAFTALAVSLGVLLHRQGQTAQQNRDVLTELREQNDAIQGLLERQAEQDRSRQQVINTAVAAIAAEQRRALVAHDESVKDYLQRALGLLDEEVNSARNRERVMPRALLLPGPVPAPTAGTVTSPKATPKAAPAPRPAPAPTPCKTRGNSGKCRR